MSNLSQEQRAKEAVALNLRPPRKVLWAGTIGNTLEFYDFIVYGSIAALVFNTVFFPSFSPVAGTLMALSTFAAGFLARPVGAAFFGTLGDRIGRRQTLMLTLVIMGGSTFLVGILPTFDQIGVAAPLMLVVLRIVQGAALGGEWGGAVIFIGEHAGASQRGRATSFAQLGSPAGTLLANGVVLALVSSMSNEQFLAWGWRVPFLLSAALVVVGLYLRLRAEETPVFEQIGQEAKNHRIPLIELFRSSWRRLFLALGVTVVVFASYYIFTTVALAHLKLAGAPSSVGLYGTVIGAAVGIPIILLVGPASDRFGRKPIIVVSTILIAVLSLFFFPLLDSGSNQMAILAIALGLALWSIGYGVYGAFLTELFPPEVRYTGVSLSYQVIGAVAGLLPVVSLSLTETFASTWPVAILLIGAALISLVATIIAPETSGRKAVHASNN